MCIFAVLKKTRLPSLDTFLVGILGSFEGIAGDTLSDVLYFLVCLHPCQQSRIKSEYWSRVWPLPACPTTSTHAKRINFHLIFVILYRVFFILFYILGKCLK
jgi:hypothetical protein